MNRSAKKQHHELARKKHKHDAEVHARELARQKPRPYAAWVIGIGVTLMIVLIIAAITS